MKTIHTLLLFFLLFRVAVFSASEPRMADADTLLNLLYAIPDFQAHVVADADRETIMYQVINNAADELLMKDQIQFGRFGNSGSIDIPVEYFTALFLLKHMPKSKDFKNMFVQEFPRSEEGYLRLVSLWMKLAAQERDDFDRYEPMISTIIKGALKNNCKLTAVKCSDYYKQAITSDINRLFQISISQQLKSLLLQPLINHYCNPDKSSLEQLHISAQAMVVWVQEMPEKKIILDTYEAMIKALGGDGYWVNFESDRNYYSSYTEEMDPYITAFKNSK